MIHCLLSSSKSTLRFRNSSISTAHLRPIIVESVSSSVLQRSTIVRMPIVFPFLSKSFNLLESIPGIRLRNSVGMNRFQSSSYSSSPPLSSSAPSFPVRAIFYKSGSLFLFAERFLRLRKISAVCLGDLDQSIYSFLKWIVSKASFEMMCAGLISPPAYTRDGPLPTCGPPYR